MRHHLFLPLSEQILSGYLLSCIAGIGDGIREAFGRKRPFRGSSPRVTPALPNSPLLLHLPLLWDCAGPRRSHPAPNFPLSFCPFSQPHHKTSEILRWVLGTGQGWVRSLVVHWWTLPLTESMSLFLYSSSSKYNQALRGPASPSSQFLWE